jgi:hypothetical protein
MITLIPEIIFTVMLSVFGNPITSGDPIDDPGKIKDFVEGPERQAFLGPTEALGGGYQKE